METTKSVQEEILDEISAALKEGGKTYDIIEKIESALAKDPGSRVHINTRVSCLTIPQRERIADKASDLRWEELKELGVYDKGKFSPGDVNCVLKALAQELNS